MTPDSQLHKVPPKQGVARIALVAASTTVICGGVILPASAATPALSHSTASPTVVTHDGDGGGLYDPGLWGDPGTGYTNGNVDDDFPQDGIYPDPYQPGQVTDDAGSVDYGDGSFYPGEDTVADGGGAGY
ncbi:hypothetical protein ACQPXS_21510 [Streptomyces sp. CA-142005]|uniref:hypothetical protein n=1 Tax=Streptomyces sp. CA-142005 TaxID=3240052 RepID=UPI003D900100